MNYSALSETYKTVRLKTEEICRPLKTEDYVVQPLADVSPPKWHLGHTTWFFETFILKQFLAGYKEFNSQYNFVFNSYYETVGARVIHQTRFHKSYFAVLELEIESSSYFPLWKFTSKLYFQKCISLICYS